MREEKVSEERVWEQQAVGLQFDDVTSDHCGKETRGKLLSSKARKRAGHTVVRSRDLVLLDECGQVGRRRRRSIIKRQLPITEH